MISVGGPADLDPETVRAIAAGSRVRVAPELLADVAANRERVLAALTADERPVYGVNTGMGRLAGVPLDAGRQAEHQLNLLVGRAVGGPPWLPEPDVRALLAVRLRDFLAPETGASADAVRFLADRLGDGFVPAVPRSGLGSAGEIIPLAHAFQTFAGVGSVLADGVEVPAAEALASRDVEPYRPGPKEGMSFLQGAPLAEAHAIMRGAEARHVVAWQLRSAACAIDVLGAPRSVYDPALAGTDETLAGVLAELRDLVAGGEPRSDVVQAPVSFRVVPQALAHALRALGDLDAAVARRSAMPTDSPAYVAGDFVSTAGFHAVELGLRMDAATAALVHLGEVCVQRTHRLLDERFSGLPPQLACDPGPQAGLTPLHKRAVGELHALRRLATPATLGSVDTSSGQEDAQAFAPAAGEQLRTAVDHVLAITACELITALQAHTLRAAPPSPALAETYAYLENLIPPIPVDRPLGPDLHRLIESLRTVSGREFPLSSRGCAGRR
jgi:histidine ammonia-lyase